MSKEVSVREWIKNYDAGKYADSRKGSCEALSASLLEQASSTYQAKTYQHKTNHTSQHYAQADYEACRKTGDSSYDKIYQEHCLRVEELVRANLLLCLTAPHPYIRKWAQLIREEK